MASILETPRRNQDAPKSQLHGTSTQGSMRERICHPLSSFSGGTFCTVTLSELGPRSSRSPTCPVLAERVPKHLGRTSHLRGGIHRLPTRLGARKHRGGQRRGPRAERTHRCSWRGGPCGRSRSSVLGRLAPPYCPSVSQARGPCVSRGEGRADTGSFTPILRWGENRELLVYFITSGTDQFPQAIAASKTAEACSQAPVC